MLFQLRHKKMVTTSPETNRHQTFWPLLHKVLHLVGQQCWSFTAGCCLVSRLAPLSCSIANWMHVLMTFSSIALLCIFPSAIPKLTGLDSPLRKSLQGKAMFSIPSDDRWLPAVALHAWCSSFHRPLHKLLSFKLISWAFYLVPNEGYDLLYLHLDFLGLNFILVLVTASSSACVTWLW